MTITWRFYQSVSSRSHHCLNSFILPLTKLWRMSSSSSVAMECSTLAESCEELSENVNTVSEGKAQVLQPKSVFYNPVQEFNRDLTVAVISEFSRRFIQDPLHQKQVTAVYNRLQKEMTKGDDVSISQEDQSDSTNSTVKHDQLQTENGFAKETAPPEAGKVCKNGIRILEGLSASGLRSVRFGLEVPGVREIIANDFDKNAVMYIEKNIQKNKLEDLVKANCGDASMVMYENREYENRFDVIDLDPHGSPARFLDGAIQAVSDGGLLCVTCTDTAIFCCNAPETCFSKYRGMSLKANFCHEMGLRIILHSPMRTPATFSPLSR